MKRLLQELRRRNVYRVGATYAVVGFVVIQAANLVLPALGIPSWAYSLVVVLTLLGFPIALVLAWAFEVTPEGIRRAKAPEGRKGAGNGVRAAAWVGLGVLVALAGVAAYRVVAPGSGPSQGTEAGTEPAAASEARALNDPIGAVAVLPFSDMSPEGDQQYFGDGLAEEILDALTRVPGLRVASRTSSFRFRGDRFDPRAIGDSLGVDAILEGSVRRAGDELKVTAQLIDTDDAFHRWSRSFERRLTAENVFDVQEEIARGIVSEMRREDKAKAGERTLVRRHGTSLENYDLYLRARFHWNRRRPQELATAIRLYRQVLERDSTFALAWAGLADAYVVPAAPMPPSEALPRAKDAARRALALDSTLAQAHTALAYALMSYDWDWEGARREFRRALELDPGYATAHQWYGEWLAARGRTGEAVASLRRAEELDPFSMIILWNVARGLYFDRRYDEAIAQVEKVQNLYPDAGRGRALLMDITWVRGNEDAAYEMLLSDLPSEERGEARDSLRAGGPGALMRLMTRLVEDWRTETTDPSAAGTSSDSLDRAAVWLALPFWPMIDAGREDEIIAFLDRLIDNRNLSALAVSLAVDPTLDPLRSDPRFRDLLRRINLSQ